MKTKKFTTTQLTMLGLMAAILMLMAYTPLGYLNIGPLAISFNVIPVAISAVVLGPVGGAVAGALASIRFLPFFRDLCLVFLMVSALDLFIRLYVRRQICMYPVQ